MWELLKLYSSSVWKYVFPLMKMFLSKEFAIAIISVKQALAETKDVSGLTTEQRRDMIFKMVSEDMKNQGFVQSCSLIYSAIKGVVKS